jgi:2'-5' RNA ligase
MKIDASDLLESGSFALVAYIPGPLGDFLQSLRDRLPGDEKPRAHITVLPPRPLKASVDAATTLSKRILKGFRPFPVTLSNVKVFPETNILYLEIANGNDKLHQLHDALNTGVLAHEENFGFLPHLTISGPVPADHLVKVKKSAAQSWKKHEGKKGFEVSQVVALWQPPRGSWDDWNRLWEQKLGDSGNSATAGRS